MPDLTGATEWINGEVKREDLVGSPTLIHFFANSCHICHENMPTIGQWRDQYAAQGLKVVAVHMPRAEEDIQREVVRKALADLRVIEPCAIDNQHEIGERFQTAGIWPMYFLFDVEGALCGRAGGYAGLTRIEEQIKKLMDSE